MFSRIPGELEELVWRAYFRAILAEMANVSGDPFTNDHFSSCALKLYRRNQMHFRGRNLHRHFFLLDRQPSQRREVGGNGPPLAHQDAQELQRTCEER